MKRTAATLILFIGIAVSHVAGADELADGVAAFDRGDYASAERILRPLAERGVPYAQYQLAVMYEDGRGIRQDEREAARLYRLAAERGLAVAQANLAVFYEQGRGVPRDLVQALLWYELAAEGESQTRRRDRIVRERDRLRRRLSPHQLDQAEAMRVAWRPRN